MELVSVIITCFNYGRFVSQAIESALGQTYPNVEVIVIDDGSTDDTRKVCAQYGTRINYFYEPNAGVSHARNQGARIANGQFLNFLDADDWLVHDKIEKQIARFHERPELDVVTCGRHDADEAGNVIRTVTPCWGDVMLENLLNGLNICPHAALMRREVFESVGGFYEGIISESWPEDVDFFIRVAASGYRFYMEEEALCYYRFHTTTVSRNNHEANFVGYLRMIDRIEGMKFPSISPRQLNRFRGIRLMGGAAAHLVKGNLNRSKELFAEVSAIVPEVLCLPKICAGAFLGAIYGRPETYRDVEIEEMWRQCERAISQAGFLTQKVQRKILSSITLYLATLAYGRGEPKIARSLTTKAFVLQPSMVMRLVHLQDVIRNYVGSRVVRALRGIHGK